MCCNVPLALLALSARTGANAAAMTDTAPRTSVKLRGVGEAAARRRAAALDRQRQHRQCLVANARRLAVFPVRTRSLSRSPRPHLSRVSPLDMRALPDGPRGAEVRTCRTGSRRRRVKLNVNSQGAPHDAPTRRPHPSPPRCVQQTPRVDSEGSVGGMGGARIVCVAYSGLHDKRTAAVARRHMCPCTPWNGSGGGGAALTTAESGGDGTTARTRD